MKTRAKLFKAFGRLLKAIKESGMSHAEARSAILVFADTDDIVFLLDVFEDLLLNLKD